VRAATERFAGRIEPLGPCHDRAWNGGTTSASGFRSAPSPYPILPVLDASMFEARFRPNQALRQYFVHRFTRYEWRFGWRLGNNFCGGSSGEPWPTAFIRGLSLGGWNAMVSPGLAALAPRSAPAPDSEQLHVHRAPCHCSESNGSRPGSILCLANSSWTANLSCTQPGTLCWSPQDGGRRRQHESGLVSVRFLVHGFLRCFVSREAPSGRLYDNVYVFCA
jgi:hypothetical protein